MDAVTVVFANAAAASAGATGAGVGVAAAATGNDGVSDENRGVGLAACCAGAHDTTDAASAPTSTIIPMRRALTRNLSSQCPLHRRRCHRGLSRVERVALCSVARLSCRSYHLENGTDVACETERSPRQATVSRAPSSASAPKASCT